MRKIKKILSIVLAIALIFIALINVSANENSTLSAKVENDTVTITGTIPGAQGKSVSIIVRSPIGNISYVDQTVASQTGSFSFKYKITNAENGNYNVSVGIENSTVTHKTSFNYSAGSQGGNQSQQLTVQVDANRNDGYVVISGKISSGSDKQISLLITDIDNNIVYAGQTVSDYYGNYSFTFKDNLKNDKSYDVAISAIGILTPVKTQIMKNTPSPMPTPSVPVVIIPSNSPTPTPSINKGADGQIEVSINFEINNNKTAKSSVDKKTLYDAMTKAVVDENGIKTVRILPSKSFEVSSAEYSLPIEVVTKTMLEYKIELVTNLATVVLPSNMIKTENIGNTSTLMVEMAYVDKAKLSEKTRTTIGDRPFIDLNIRLDDKVIAWENKYAPVEVSIPYKPTEEEQKNPEHIVVWYIDNVGNVVSIPNGRYDERTGKVTFTTTHLSQYAVAFVQKTFGDIASYDWAKKQIEVLASKGIINGTTEKTFSPSYNIKRADFISLIVRTLELSAIIDNNFSDVNPQDYYYREVGIAKKLGIVNGVGDNKFNPQDQITRQDMMVMVAKAMKLLNKIKVDGLESDLNAYNDKEDIASYAANSISTLVKNGLVQGDGYRINPLGTATRAETAVIMYRILNFNDNLSK